MKFLMIALLAIGSLLGNPAQAQGLDNTADAQAAAAKWLALMDASDFAATWDQGAVLFRSAVTREAWSAKIKPIRQPLGKLKSRTVQAAAYKASLPGAPAGEYVIIQYASSFENLPAATETVTPMREKDGSWRVSGYYIK